MFKDKNIVCHFLLGKTIDMYRDVASHSSNL